ncbi:MAG TPA: ATP-binding protein, partial [Stellaceae bacterium]|nr:ATP-binding protein [Stellaceae bacterium]
GASIIIIAAERMVRQILLNILSNAVKFTPPGGRVTLSAKIQESGELVIAVADTGIGMTPAEIGVAMTPFGQVDNRLSRKHSGTGLGLPLAKAMMELHGGKLTIKSAPQRGTTVALIFPAARLRRRAAAPAPVLAG